MFDRATVDEDWVSAFTVAELGEMLPNYVYSSKLKALQKWSAGKYSNGDVLSGVDIGVFYADTEADCRAKMLIYLINNKLITVK